MKITRFYKLKQALANLDYSYVAKKIAQLEDRLTKHGQAFDPVNTAVTQEGIFYIHPESGMAAKVVLYESDHPLKIETPPQKDLYLTGYTDAKVLNKLNPYHLVRCNVLTEAEKNGWAKHYRVAQRSDGSFYYRFVKKTKGPVREEDVYQEIENQRLFICENCYMKINSLIEGLKGLKRESFPLKYFFDVDFFRSWCRYGDNFRAGDSIAGMYPKDWQEISRIRMEQVHYHCETCNGDLADPALHRFLHVHPTDYVKQKISYVKLQCLCIGCLADYPDRAHFKNHPDYEAYMGYLGKGVLEPRAAEEPEFPVEDPAIVLSAIMSRQRLE